MAILDLLFPRHREDSTEALRVDQEHWYRDRRLTPTLPAKRLPKGTRMRANGINWIVDRWWPEPDISFKAWRKDI